MRDIIREVETPVSTLVGAFLLVLGVLIVFPIILMISFFPSLCLVLWIPILLCISYIVLGVGLIGRRSWAHSGARIFMVLMILLLLGALVFTAGSLSWVIIVPGIILHIAIILILGERGREFGWRPRRAPSRIQHASKTEISGLACEECGSENLTVYRDGSGICIDCRHVFADVLKKGE
ncbi:MAG: hypothetical protein ACE5QF_07750 [Thermoplasmata archaeon]